MTSQGLRLNGRAKTAEYEATTRAVDADLPFLIGVSIVYVLATLAIVFTVDRFWSFNWDVEIYLGAARSFYDGGSLFDLYEKSRAQFYWPYPYPPLYAMILTPFAWLADRAFMPEWAAIVAARLPVLVADLGIALLLYTIVWETVRERLLARLAALAWLFTPILFYHTAIQGHQETLWLLPALAAYWWLARHGLRRVWWPALLLTLAVAVKQSAVLYLIPLGAALLWKRHWRDVVVVGAVFVVLFGGLVLPFHLYSDDFAYMVFVDVPNMPVQTQSWVVWLLGLEEFLVEQTRSTFPLIEHASLILLGLTTLVSFGALTVRPIAERAATEEGRDDVDADWFSLALVITLLFFLTSQKVMAYHYPMIVPWLLAAFVPARRLKLVAPALVWVSWIVVSPYYAPWADAERLPLYASLGTFNSLFFLGLLLYTVRTWPQPVDAGDTAYAGGLLGWLVLLSLGFVLTALAHPLTKMAPDPGHTREVLVFAALAATVVLTVGLYTPIARFVGRRIGAAAERLRAVHVLVALWLVPLFFTWFTMTREITAVIEDGLWEAWGL